MIRKTIRLALPLLALGLAAGSAWAQSVGGFRGEVLGALGESEKKILGLAEKTPQDKFGWRPAAGVRSTSEVFMHVAAGNYFLGGFAGLKAPEGLRDYEKTTDKAKVVAALKDSYAAVRKLVESTPDADLAAAVKLPWRETTKMGLFMTLALHSEEHLGQSIAYARSNGIVPPWSEAPPKPPAPAPK